MIVRRSSSGRGAGRDRGAEASGGNGTSELGRELREEIRRAVSEQLRAALQGGLGGAAGQDGGRGWEADGPAEGTDPQRPIIQVVLPPGGDGFGRAQGSQGGAAQGAGGGQGGAPQGAAGGQYGGQGAAAVLGGGARNLLAASEEVTRELESHLPRLRQVIAETQKIAEKIELLLGQGGSAQGARGGQGQGRG